MCEVLCLRVGQGVGTRETRSTNYQVTTFKKILIHRRPRPRLYHFELLKFGFVFRLEEHLLKFTPQSCSTQVTRSNKTSNKHKVLHSDK